MTAHSLFWACVCVAIGSLTASMAPAQNLTYQGHTAVPLDEMAQQLEQLRQEHAERAERRAEIIQQELNSLLRGVVNRSDSAEDGDDTPRGPRNRHPGHPAQDPPADEQVENDSQAQD